MPRIALPMREASTSQFADGPLCRILGVATLRIGMESEDQLPHRESGRVFVEEERQNGAFSPAVFTCRGRVLVSHEEVLLLWSGSRLGVPPPTGAASSEPPNGSRTPSIRTECEFDGAWKRRRFFYARHCERNGRGDP